MPGVFSKSNRPRRPGAYVNWEAIKQAIIAPNIGSIVAVPLLHDWGPFKQGVLLNSLSDFKSVYGDSEDTPGFLAVREAFLGEAVTGWGGAGAVLAYRFGTTTAAKASHSFQNTATTDALTITATYEGSRGNDLRVTIQDHATSTGKDEFILLDNTRVLETYVYNDTDVAGLAAQINTVSGWVQADALVDAVSLTHASGTALTTGDDGATLIADDWTDAMTALELQRFGILAPYDLTDDAVITALQVWSAALNLKGKRFMTVIGGELDETVADAVSAAQSLADPNFIRVGVGSVADTEYLDASNNATVLSTAQLAPRIAGILANRGEAHSITFGRLAGIDLLVGPTETEIEQAFDGGVVVLARDSNLESPVRIERGLTTYTQTNDRQRPYVIYRNPKFLRTMHGIEYDFTRWAEDNVIGKLPVNDDSRSACIAEVSARLKIREKAFIVQPGWNVSVDPEPAPSDDDEFIALLISLRFARSAEQVFFTIRVG